ncbi:hypothetical protein MMMB2_2506 [Mycobacterium marinum MB2]|nr:hypothetical protein MMMB2_2506 [Mycobacterium marinum MB2]
MFDDQRTQLPAAPQRAQGLLADVLSAAAQATRMLGGRLPH